ncbi:MAG: hypothetical protein JSS35_07400 [Proteobacteria bacterium]|nr:hypothetical protein [Pseudomonadota bacterium]
MTRYSLRRLAENPIIRPGMEPRMGSNIQGPSLIRTPPWLAGALGRYHLYFADHKGGYIRLAYADWLEGPWTVHPPGALRLEHSGFITQPPPIPVDAQALSDEARARARIAPPATPGVPDIMIDATCPHVASPDVHVDHQRRRIVMYYHGLESFRVQRTRAAVSQDGVTFGEPSGVLGPAYFRVFRHGGFVYAMSMPGTFHRSIDGLGGFETGPTLFPPDQRHSALLLRGDILHVFWTRVGDAPERIYVSEIDLSGDWASWRAGDPQEIARPEAPWEGAGLPLEPSWRSAVSHPVNQLRDPCIYEEDGRVFLLYAVQGEHGIGIAELSIDA